MQLLTNYAKLLHFMTSEMGNGDDSKKNIKKTERPYNLIETKKKKITTSTSFEMLMGSHKHPNFAQEIK